MFLVDMDLAAVAPAFAAQESNDQHQRLDTLKQFVVRHHTVSFFTVRSGEKGNRRVRGHG